MTDCKKSDFAKSALAIATEIYDSRLTRMTNEAPPMLLAPFGAGQGPLLNTLRNKLFVGEVAERSDLQNALAEAQALLTLAQDAYGKARKSS